MNFLYKYVLIQQFQLTKSIKKKILPDCINIHTNINKSKINLFVYLSVILLWLNRWTDFYKICHGNSLIFEERLGSLSHWKKTSYVIHWIISRDYCKCLVRWNWLNDIYFPYIFSWNIILENYNSLITWITIELINNIV